MKKTTRISVIAHHPIYAEHRGTRVATVLVATALLGLALGACSREAPPQPASQAPAAGAAGGVGPAVDAHGHTAPEPATIAANQAVASELPLADPQDFEDAARGLVGREENVVVQGADGKTIWDTRDYAFIDGEAPASVNPSLWRQAKLNDLHGLYEVTDGVYQAVR